MTDAPYLSPEFEHLPMAQLMQIQLYVCHDCKAVVTNWVSHSIWHDRVEGRLDE